MPLPPPPAAAFNITGYPIFSAISNASFNPFTLPSEPGITGTPAFFIISFALDLFPNNSIISDFGPINFIFDSSHIWANFEFSDKNPKPG